MWSEEIVDKAARALSAIAAEVHADGDPVPFEFRCRQARAVLGVVEGEAVPVEWVAQRGEKDCGIAAMAMVMGYEYERVETECVAMFDMSSRQHGLYTPDAREYLARQGCFLAERFVAHAGDDWPPEPWAPVHYVQVRQPSGEGHFLVMDASGDVFDPLREGRFRLADWETVNQVVGVLRPPVSSFGVPSQEEDCASCGAPAGYPPAGPCPGHPTRKAPNPLRSERAEALRREIRDGPSPIGQTGADEREARDRAFKASKGCTAREGAIFNDAWAAAVEWAAEHGATSMVKWFVDSERAAQESKRTGRKTLPEAPVSPSLGDPSDE